MNNKTPFIPAKKSLGQNFCKDERISLEMVARLAATTDDIIWEIGPGTGALTEQLITAGAEMHLFEIDQRMEEPLTKKFPGVNITWGDFLQIPTDKLPKVEKPLLACGNLPYYCGTPIIKKFLQCGPHAKKLVFLLQEEVALKAASHENQPNYGFLSVQISLFANAVAGSTFPPSSFVPQPKINSTILELTPLVLSNFEKERRQQALKKISVIFLQRRKMVLPLLRKKFPDVNWQERFTSLQIEEKARPENISPLKLLELFSD